MVPSLCSIGSRAGLSLVLGARETEACWLPLLARSWCLSWEKGAVSGAHGADVQNAQESCGEPGGGRSRSPSPSQAWTRAQVQPVDLLLSRLEALHWHLALTKSCYGPAAQFQSPSRLLSSPKRCDARQVAASLPLCWKEAKTPFTVPRSACSIKINNKYKTKLCKAGASVCPGANRCLPPAPAPCLVVRQQESRAQPQPPRPHAASLLPPGSKEAPQLLS